MNEKLNKKVAILAAIGAITIAIIAYFLFLWIDNSLKSWETKSISHHQLVEKNNRPGFDSTDVYTVIGVGTSVGRFKRIEVRKDKSGMIYSFISDMPLKKGQKVLIDVYFYYTSEEQKNPNRSFQVRKILPGISLIEQEIKINNLRGIMSNGDTLTFDRYGE